MCRFVRGFVRGFQMAAGLLAASLFSKEKKDIIFSNEASMTDNPGAAFLSALTFLLLMGRPMEAAAVVTSPSSEAVLVESETDGSPLLAIPKLVLLSY